MRLGAGQESQQSPSFRTARTDRRGLFQHSGHPLVRRAFAHRRFGLIEELFKTCIRAAAHRQPSTNAAGSRDCCDARADQAPAADRSTGLLFAALSFNETFDDRPG